MKNLANRYFLVTFALVLSSSALLAQPSPSDITTSSTTGSGLAGLTRRSLVEGVLTVVPPDQNSIDTALGPFDLDFVADHADLAWTAPDFPENAPNFASQTETLLAMSRDVIFRHPVWGLEFSFKPARFIEVDVPQPSGKMKRKVVWYLIYKVRYRGEDLAPSVTDPNDTEEVPAAPKRVKFNAVRFLPRFTMVSKERNIEMDAQVLAPAVSAIAAKERVGAPLHDHIEIGKMDILPSEIGDDNAVWGVATWTDVDPRVDFFAIDVRGLTNAYQIKLDSAGAKNYLRKTLRIYFWRPGDSIDEARDRILLGAPAFEDPARVQYYLNQFGLKERLDYQWIYR